MWTFPIRRFGKRYDGAERCLFIHSTCCLAKFSPRLKEIQVGMLITISPLDVDLNRMFLVPRRLVSFTSPAPSILTILTAKIYLTAIFRRV